MKDVCVCVCLFNEIVPLFTAVIAMKKCFQGSWYVGYFELLFPFCPPADLQLDYSLTDDFCRNHFLVGLLMREVGGALQEFREVRHIAVQVLKGLMIKHTFDDRYAAKVSEIPGEDGSGELGVWRGGGWGRWHFETCNYSVKCETF